MDDNKHGIIFFTILVIVVIIERLMNNYLNYFGKMVIYGILLCVLLMYFVWIFKNTEYLKADFTDLRMQRFDSMSFESIMVPLLYVIGILFLALSVNSYFRYRPNTDMAVTLAIFGLLYLPMAFFISKHNKQKKKKKKK